MKSELREDGIRIFYARSNMIPVSNDLMRYARFTDQVGYYIDYNLFEVANMRVRSFKARECYKEFIVILLDRIDEAEELRSEEVK